MDWATVAKSQPVAAPSTEPDGEAKPRVAVVDANALITQHGILNLVRGAHRGAACMPRLCAAARWPPPPPLAAACSWLKTSRPRALLQARYADRCVTTPEVMREVRDKQSRAALEALPFKIETREPSDESVKAGACQPLRCCCRCCCFAATFVGRKVSSQPGSSAA